jgi:hypothetical protein
LETSSIFERGEVGARRLGRFLVSLHDRITTSVDTGNESKYRGSGSQAVEVQHDGGTSSECVNEKLRRRKVLRKLLEKQAGEERRKGRSRSIYRKLTGWTFPRTMDG